MIESSLIAVTQPAGASSLLAGVGPAPLGSAGAALAGVSSVGKAGDGFRERFEATVGLERPVTMPQVAGDVENGSDVAGSGGLGGTPGLWRPGVVRGGPVAGGTTPGTVPEPPFELGVSDSASVSDTSAPAEPASEIAMFGTVNELSAAKWSAGAPDTMQVSGGHSNLVRSEPERSVEGLNHDSSGVQAINVQGAKATGAVPPTAIQSEVRVQGANGAQRSDAVETLAGGGEGVDDPGISHATTGRIEKPAVLDAETLAPSVISNTPSGGVIGASAPLIKALRGNSAGPLPASHVASAPSRNDQRKVGVPEKINNGVDAVLSAPAGVPANDDLARGGTLELASTALTTPARIGTGLAKSAPVIAGRSVGVTATSELGANLYDPAIVTTLSKDPEAATAVVSKSSEAGSGGSKRNVNVVLDSASTEAASPVATRVFAPAAALAGSDHAVLAQAIVSTEPVALNVAAASDANGPERGVAALSSVKHSVDGTPAAATSTNRVVAFSESMSKVGSLVRDGDASTPQPMSLAAGRDVPQPKGQGLAGVIQGPKTAPALDGAISAPLTSLNDTIGDAHQVTTDHLADNFAGSVDPVLTSLAETPVAAVPVAGNRTAVSAKDASVAGVAPVTANDTKGPTVNAPIVAAQAGQGEGDKPTSAAAAKVGSEPIVDAKVTVGHGLAETAQNGAAAVVLPQAHAGLGNSNAAVTSGPTPASARVIEFAGMTRGNNALDHATLVSTPNVLEVGVASGTNGWLKVRAEMDGTGGVAASVVATTASAAEALHRELPALSAYLRDESVGVSSLVVNRSDAGAMAQDVMSNLGSGGFGPGSQAGRGGQSGANDAPVQAEPVMDAVEPMRSSRFDGAEANAASGYGRGSGGWLNVVA